MAAKRSAVAQTSPRTPPAPAGVACIPLGAELGIEEASGLHRQLLGAVDEPGPVELQAGEVRAVHTAALELFCLFCRDRRAAGRETRWSEPSEALRSAATLLGMNSLLGLLALSQDNPAEVAA
ncbi:STAS domain-containing protein [Stagnimonas aquatica]|uniref:STAS domain-containing protein n=1 Tax=Stagnimonas aquatica TaxID=2689987 RepID=A0A3N0VDT1_9GAMM|nr:STAS domain-containing protein [Stagnimonas aquatica]ROH90804.1 STAS domain-containing protein [Stagnimonas aquatica]